LGATDNRVELVSCHFLRSLSSRLALSDWDERFVLDEHFAVSSFGDGHTCDNLASLEAPALNSDNCGNFFACLCFLAVVDGRKFGLPMGKHV
jgi:hypothetical protein